jgi:tetratricopeptide (TPR) repeat protein
MKSLLGHIIVLHKPLKKAGVILFFTITVTLFVFTQSTSLNQSMGNIFFGGTPSLYNVNIAQYFFKRASHPLFSTPAPWAYYQLGRTDFIKGDLSTALSHFDTELQYYPEHYKVYYMKGLTLGYMHKEKEAIEMFSKYIENTNDTWASYNDKAWLQFRIGDINGALETIEPVAKAQPYNPWIANTYGVLLMNKGRLGEAKNSFLKGQEKLATMTEEDWGVAYPGNDPRIYTIGFNAMKQSFANNIQLVEEKLASTDKSE